MALLLSACGASTGTTEMSAAPPDLKVADLTFVCPAPTPDECAAGGVTFCVDFQNDGHNCGACGTLCPAGAACQKGQCAISCESGTMPCPASTGGIGGFACANLQTDNTNCGACGVTCPGGATCQGAVCSVTCINGYSSCPAASPDGGVGGFVCASLQTDSSNCGACGTACPIGTACVAGQCAIRCGAGLTSCALASDGGSASQCVSLQSDSGNCGACGMACAAGSVCQAGKCQATCPVNSTACPSGKGGMVCTNLQTDSLNCGACGTVCPSGAFCNGNKCLIACAAGFTTCPANNTDGGVFGLECANLLTDNSNCGACGTTCAKGSICQSGACTLTCQQGLTACTSIAGDGVDGGVGGSLCVDLRNDNRHCGACGTQCTGTNSCNNGTCTTCQSVLLLGDTATPPTTLTDALMASTNAFCSVSYLNANSGPAAAVAAMLGQYQAILVYNDTAFNDTPGISAAITNYFNLGGRVVVAPFADAGYTINPSFGSFMVINASGVFTSQAADSFTTGSSDVVIANSPILSGVGSFSGTGWHTAITTSNGGMAVAKWHVSGNPIAATGVINGRNRVDITIHPTDVANGGWGTANATNPAVVLIRNALLYK